MKAKVINLKEVRDQRERDQEIRDYCADLANNTKYDHDMQMEFAGIVEDIDIHLHKRIGEQNQEAAAAYLQDSKLAKDLESTSNAVSLASIQMVDEMSEMERLLGELT